MKAPLLLNPALTYNEVPSAIVALLISSFVKVVLEPIITFVPNAAFSWPNSEVPHSPVKVISVASFNEDGMSSAGTDTASCALAPSAQNAVIIRELIPLYIFLMVFYL